LKKYNSVCEFIQDNLSENRLHQGSNCDERKQSSPFISSQWVYFSNGVVGDVKKECQMEIEANAIDEKMLNKKQVK